MIWQTTAGLPSRRVVAAARRALRRQPAQVDQLLVEVGQVRVEHRGDPLTGLLAASLEVKDVLDLIQTQVQGLGTPDEVQDRDVVGGEQAISGLSPFGFREQSLALEGRIALAVSPVCRAAFPTVTSCIIVLLLRGRVSV